MDIYERIIQNIGKQPPIMLRKFQFFAKHGIEWTKFDTEKEAISHSSIVEKRCINEDELLINRKLIREYNEKYQKEYKKLLREKYPSSHFDVIFEFCDKLDILDINDHERNFAVFWEFCNTITKTRDG